MKSAIRNLIVATITLATVSGVAFAGGKNGGQKPQRNNHPATQPTGEKGGPGARMEKMQKVLDQLNLTDEQKAKIEEIKTEVKEKLQSLRGELKNLSPEERKAKIQEVVGNIREKIAAVLTDEQKTQFKEKMKEMREQNQQDGGKKVKA